MSDRRPSILALALAGAALSFVGCKSGNSPPTRPADAPTPETPRPEETPTMLSDAELITKARAAAKGIEFSPNAGDPIIERDGKTCTVRFPIDHPTDMPVLGPDYDAEVDLDCESGAVAAVRVGS